MEYIVENTIGKLVENKKPNEVKEIKIVDPACGSGSFLIGAYQFLLDWHIKYYSNNKAAAKKDNALTPTGTLTTAIKKQILLNNIYGVDLDANAVEVTKLSLLLKCLEGETFASIAHQHSMFNERVLPTLDNNIKSGNSLIDFDIYDSQLDFGEEKKIKPFNWQKAFPEVFNRKVNNTKENLQLIAAKAKQHAKKAMEYAEELEEKLNIVNDPNEITKNQTGGFDVVIGNPPYGAGFSNLESNYFQSKYNLQNYQLESYFLFIEKSLDILLENSLLGFIIPNTWLSNLKTSKIRQFLFTKTEMNKIVHYQIPVFKQAVVDTEIMIFRNKIPSENHEIEIEIYDKQNARLEKKIKQQNWIQVAGEPVSIFDEKRNESIKKRIANLPILDSICKITQGTKPFQVGKGKPQQTRQIVDEKPYVSETKKDNSFRPLLRGSMMNRYQTNWNNNYFIKFGDWLAEPRYSAGFDLEEKIIIRQTGDNLNATIDTQKFIVRDNLYTVVHKKPNINLYFILGIINSRFLNWYYQNIINPEKGEALAQVKRGHLAQLPIKLVDSNNKKEIALQNDIIKLVDQLLLLNKEKQEARLESKIETLKNKIDYCEEQINKKVYELYELSPEEINIVEGK